MGDGAKAPFGKVGTWFGRWLVPILVVFLVALGGAFLYVMSGDCPKYWSADCPEWWLKAFGVKDKSRVLEYLGIAAGGVLAAMGLVFAHRRSGAMVKENENVEKGQRQERLKNAIKHLGHERVSVRLGGAYELSHLAEDNPELRQTVLDILCVHVRQWTSKSTYRNSHGMRTGREIQSLLTLLFVEKHDVFAGLSANLHGSWLNAVDLRGARLNSANLHGAYLQGADLAEAQLRGADLCGARLRGANLGEAQLQGAKLIGAKLQGANLFNTRLQGAKFGDTHMRGTISVGDFTASNFAENLRGRSDQPSDLSNVVFTGGLTREDVDRMATEMANRDEAAFLRRILKKHIDRPKSNELPEGCGAIFGTYTAEEAEAWIAEYEEAM